MSFILVGGRDIHTRGRERKRQTEKERVIVDELITPTRKSP